MPIDSDEFEKGRKLEGMERTILQFLKADKSKAFNQSEITASLYRLSKATLLDFAKGVLVVVAVGSALDSLVKDGSVKAKQVDHETYYKAA